MDEARYVDIIKYGYQSGPIPSDIFSIKLVDSSELLWQNWLPEAPLPTNDQPGEITLSFAISAANKTQAFRLRSQLLGVSWYPGGWTNDYFSVDSEYDPFLEVDRQAPGSERKWSSRQTYRWAPDSLNADLRMENSYFKNGEVKQINPNWDFLFQQSTNENDFPFGWEEAEYVEPVYDQDTISITLTSYDYAASGYLSMGLARWVGDSTHWQNFTPQEFVRFNDSTAAWVLPVPRDMELTYKKFAVGDPLKPDSIEKVVDLGDRLGDAWELFNGYPSIEKCLPYVDDSIQDLSYFPQDSNDKIIFSSGDGLMNLEKYRGIYGILDGVYEGYYSRIYPLDRNIFVSIFESDSLKNTSIFSLKNNPNQFDSLSSVNHSVGDSIRIINIIPSANGLDSSYYYHNIGVFNGDKYEFFSALPYYNGTLRLNSRLTRLPDQKICSIIWNMNYASRPNGVPKKSLGGNVYHPGLTMTFVDTTKFNDAAPYVAYSHTYFSEIKDMVYQSPLPAYLVDNVIHKLQYVAQEHEMGHHVRMHHTYIDTRTIMYYKMDFNYLTGKMKTGTLYINNDLKSLMITN